MTLNDKVTGIKTVLYWCKNRQEDKETHIGNEEIEPSTYCHRCERTYFPKMELILKPIWKKKKTWGRQGI